MSDRLRWKDLYRGKANKQSLIQLLMCLYSNLEPKSNQRIVKQMEDFFVDKNGNELFENVINQSNKSKVVSDWIKSKTDYSNKIDIHFLNTDTKK